MGYEDTKDDAKEGMRNVENKAKETWRKADGDESLPTRSRTRATTSATARQRRRRDPSRRKSRRRGPGREAAGLIP